MKISEKLESMVIPADPITVEGVARMRKHYWGRYGRKPSIVRLSLTAKNVLLQQLYKELPAGTDMIFGMRIEVDPSLQHGEWRVGYSQERIYVVEAEDV